MERLTYKDKTVPHVNAKGELWEAYSDRDYNEVINKLAAYEEAEEQGLLVKLPCKVGDRVYRIYCRDHIKEDRVIGILISESGLWYWDENGRETPVEKIGKTVFLTLDEAEDALKGEREDV